MFRTEPKQRFYERPAVRYVLAGVLLIAAAMAFMVTRDLASGGISPRDTILLAGLLLILVLTGTSLILLLHRYNQTRDRLAYLKQYAQDILQSLSIGVVTSDLAGRITNINERARSLADTGPDGAGRPYRDVLSHAPLLADQLETLLARGEEFSGRDVEVRASGKPLTLRLEGRFLLDDAGRRNGALLQMEDVSQLRHMDQEIRRTEKLAGLGTVAAGIAHEIKNPLAGLSIHAQLLEEAIGQATPKTHKYLGVIQSEVTRLKQIIDHYISFARPRPIAPGPASLEAIVGSVLRLVEPECAKAGIRAVQESALEPAARFLVDEAQLQQAILNLALNAIQAMEHGGTLTCRLAREGAFATIAVSDTGPGIPEEARGRIFDLFYTTRPGGTGLGLYLTQRIVAEHKGYVDLKSGPGGTTFTVAIPAETAK